MKKFMLIGLVLVVIMAVVVYFMIFQKEVDDVAENGPIQSEIIPVIRYFFITISLQDSVNDLPLPAE